MRARGTDITVEKKLNHNHEVVRSVLVMTTRGTKAKVVIPPEIIDDEDAYNAFIDMQLELHWELLNKARRKARSGSQSTPEERQEERKSKARKEHEQASHEVHEMADYLEHRNGAGA